VLIDFYFRGIPRKLGQHFAFGGRVEVTFRAYALNDEEVKMLNQKLGESDVNDALKLISGMTDESLEQLRDDIEHFLEEEKQAESKPEPSGTNPFAALLGVGEGKESAAESSKKEVLITKIKKDSYAEGKIRKVAETSAIEICFKLFDVYKKAHGMASYPATYPSGGEEEKWRK
jgi:hypothetical protein